jgi:hypothetical protein
MDRNNHNTMARTKNMATPSDPSSYDHGNYAIVVSAENYLGGGKTETVFVTCDKTVDVSDVFACFETCRNTQSINRIYHCAERYKNKAK